MNFTFSASPDDMSLLDDLHLDSIKATELTGNISMQYNVADELANLQLNNAKLRVQTGGKTSFFYDV